MDFKVFMKALDEIEEQKHVSKDAILQALKESMEKGFIKQLSANDQSDLEEVRVRVDIDTNKKHPSIRMVTIRKVVQDVLDDALEIELEEANNNENGVVYNIGDDYEEEVDTEELTKFTAQNIKSILKQKMAEAEKAAIYEAYSGKIGEMISGVVDKVDRKFVAVNVQNTMVYVNSQNLIPGESFEAGDTIKLYVVDVENSTKGTTIKVSRSHEGFLRRIFEQEIPEILNGTIFIRGVAREAGLRSKVAVSTNDINVNPVSSCIGQDHVRIDHIVSELGNKRDSSEKIDVIQYSDNAALYILNALGKVDITGIYINEADKKAIVAVKNGQLSLAIGKNGCNARLVAKLTGWSIDIKEQEEALTMGLRFLTREDIENKIKDEEAIKRLDQEIESYTNDVVEEQPSEDIDISEQVELQEEPVTEEQPEIEKPISVKTTTNLSALESLLENQQKRLDNKNNFKKRDFKKKFNSDEEDEEVEDGEAKAALESVQRMDIYSAEELQEFENSENEEEYEDEEVDYDQYDSYYDAD
ncbi:MAG: transcription termination factor NusA [Bacilli bacterium]|nr:transcription termination factor NusA [Bacilli bacterium]